MARRLVFPALRWRRRVARHRTSHVRRPSSEHGTLPNRSDRSSDPARRLYSELKRQGFGRAHLTDVIKERALGRGVEEIERDKGRMERYRRYLQKEIEIIRPHLIVAMGARAYRILTDWLGSDAPVRPIQHYSLRYPSTVTRRRFRARLSDIQREYERICGRRNAPGPKGGGR
ncbi:MAG: hypothetical protein DMF89_17620 [Acidobacteria bacterium]|nr:MAG: hypothetical protein DMF89_17620 [Acidobacteriota bacterium]